MKHGDTKVPRTSFLLCLLLLIFPLLHCNTVTNVCLHRQRRCLHASGRPRYKFWWMQARCFFLLPATIATSLFFSSALFFSLGAEVGVPDDGVYGQMEWDLVEGVFFFFFFFFLFGDGVLDWQRTAAGDRFRQWRC